MLAAGALPSGGDVRKESPADLGTERLRIGALSDIHIKGTQAQPCFEKTLRTLDAWKADVVMASAISPTTGCGSSWSSSRANDYEVTAILRQGDVERVLCQKRVFSLRYLFGDKMDTEPVVCLFSKEEIPDGWPIRYEVRPVNACGRKDAPIGTAFEKSGWR